MDSVSIEDVDSTAVDSSSPFGEAAAILVISEYTAYTGNSCSFSDSMVF